MEYDVLKQKFVAAEKEYNDKAQAAKKSYDELIEKYFYSMRDKIVDVLKDVPQKEFVEWLDKAKDDKSIEPKMFMLVQMCWRETHKDEVEIDREELHNLAADLAILSLLRGLL